MERRPGQWTNIADLGLAQNELWKAIDGCRLRYRRGPVRLVLDSPYWALLATYILGDGDLARNSLVRFYDNEKATLNTIRDMFSERYEYSFPNPVYEENQYGRGQWVVRTRHAAIHFVLTEYFNVPIGRQKRTSALSDTVVSSRDPEVRAAALAGMFSSDGYVNCNKAHGRFSVGVCLLTTVSDAKAQGCSRMLRELGFHPFVCVARFQNPLSHRDTTAYRVVVNRHAEVVGLLFRLFPYLLKPSRARRWMELIGDVAFYKRIRVRAPEAHLILRKAAIKIAGNSYRYLHVLVDLAHVHGIEVRRWSGVKHWTSGKRSIPLVVLVECCRILGKNVLDYMAEDFAPLLWLRRVIDYETLISLRGIKPLLELKEMNVPMNQS